MKKTTLRTALVAIILVLVLGPGWALADDTDWMDPQGCGSCGLGDCSAALTSNDVYASASAVSLAECSFGDYSLGIPECAEIHGIEVGLEWYGVETDEDDFALGVQISWNSGGDWTGLESDLSEPASDSDTLVLLGGPTDTWGHNWTPDQLSNDNFGVKVVAESDPG